MRNVAIVLAGGSGSRMKSAVKKQYLLLGGRPVLWHSLKTFQEHPQIHGIVLVCGAGEVERCRKEFVEEYGFTKVTAVVEGGAERYLSVYEGVKAVRGCDRVLVHDGARPFVDAPMLDRVLAALEESPAVVVAVKTTDTIKLADENGIVQRTLPRENLWSIQTPQAFSHDLLLAAYERLFAMDVHGPITDDAMVVETAMRSPIRLVLGSYRNIKITTPEDLVVAEAFFKEG